MRTLCRLLALVVLLGAVAAPPVADAKSRKNKHHKRPATRKGEASELPKVTKVGNEMITVGGKVYLVTEDTRITVNGRAGCRLGSVKRGMQCLISGSVIDYGKTSRDTFYKATSITARTANKIKTTNNKNRGNKRRKR